MSIVSTESFRFESMEKVAELTFKGFNATQIAKQIGIPRKEVVALQEDYRTALSNDSEARDMARDYLNQMVQHYDQLIKKFYELVDEIDSLDFNHQVAGQKNATLKSIAELEAKRLDALQKAGLLENSDLGDELVRWEEEKELVLKVLKGMCKSCKVMFGQEITRLNGGHVDPVDIVEGEIV